MCIFTIRINSFRSDYIVLNEYDAALEVMSSGTADVLLGAGVVKRGLIGVEYSQPYLQNWWLFLKNNFLTIKNNILHHLLT